MYRFLVDILRNIKAIVDHKRYWSQQSRDIREDSFEEVFDPSDKVHVPECSECDLVIKEGSVFNGDYCEAHTWHMWFQDEPVMHPDGYVDPRWKQHHPGPEDSWYDQEEQRELAFELEEKERREPLLQEWKDNQSFDWVDWQEEEELKGTFS